MRKLFTLALAVLASASMWAGTETFTFALSDKGTKGYCYSLEGPASGAFLENNAIYYTSVNGPAKDGDSRLNPYKTGIVFAPKMDLTMAVSLVAGSSARTFSLRIEEIQKDYVWDAFVNCAGEATTMSEKIFELADDTEKAWWKENTSGKVITGDGTEKKPYKAGTDDGSKKYMSGESTSEGMAKNVGTSDNISVNKNETLEEAEIKVNSNAYTFSKDKKYRLYLSPSSSTGLGLVSITFTAACEAPETALSLDADKKSDIYAGDNITLTIAGGNGAETSMTLDGDAFTGTSWTAVKGDHTFVLSQDDKDGVCGNTVELKLAVASTDKVESAVVSGPSGTYLEKAIILTCTAENATNYQWYKDGVAIADATNAEYEYNPSDPDEVGEFAFSCEAWNKFNSDSDHAKSADWTVTVAEGLCGVLATIKATAYNQATLTGEFTGTASANLSKKDSEKSEHEGETGYKLNNKGSYLGADFTDGTLKAGDKVIVFVTTVSPKMQIFSDKGNTLIAETETVVQGENTLKLDDRAEGATGLYVYRVLDGTEGAQYNPYVAYIELKRPCSEESSDATLSLLKVGEDEIELEEGKYDYEYEVAADVEEEQVEITFELNDAKSKADVTSPKKILVPKEGASIDVTITITAEDGTKATYTLTISRAEAPKSDKAEIEELKIENETITAVNDTFSYEVSADVEATSVTVEFTLADGATADKTSPLIVDIPAAGEEAEEVEIVVTAEDGTTEHTYVVSVSRAEEEEQGVENVQGDKVQSTKILRDGQMYILRGGKMYNIVGAELRQ